MITPQDLETLELLAQTRRTIWNRFDPQRPHSYPDNDWVAFVQANAQWYKFYCKLYGQEPPDDSIELVAKRYQKWIREFDAKLEIEKRGAAPRVPRWVWETSQATEKRGAA